MPNSPPHSNLTFGQYGSTATPVYMGTEVKIYPVTEERLDNISAFSAASLILFSFGSLFVSAALEIINAAGIQNSLSNLSVQVTLLCYALGIYFWIKKGGTLRRIKKDCYKLNVATEFFEKGVK